MGATREQRNQIPAGLPLVIGRRLATRSPTTGEYPRGVLDTRTRVAIGNEGERSSPQISRSPP